MRTGSLTFTIAFHTGGAEEMLSTSIVTSPPSCRNRSWKLTFHSRSIFPTSAKALGLEDVAISRTSSNICAGFDSTNDQDMIDLGETKSRLPRDDGAASQDAMPRRGPMKLSSH